LKDGDGGWKISDTMKTPSGAGRFVWRCRFPWTLLIALGLWALFAWPLPRHLASAIPFTGHLSGDVMRDVVPGDHLQLLYHLWLFADMVEGHTPWFHNLYAFNVGDDAARFEPEPFYLPFSAFYAIGQWVGGPAFGWNLTGLIALWLGYAFTVRLVQRYEPSPWVARVAALPAMLLPFRWEALLGGSPSGLAMMWIPALLLGLDVALREERARGGWLAGLAILGSSFGDLHVLAFALMAAPVWSVLALLMRPDFRWTRIRAYRPLVVALLPTVGLAALTFYLRSLVQDKLDTSTMAAGRSLAEVALFSPHVSGFLRWHTPPITNQIYVGLALVGLLGVGAWAVAMVWRAQPRTWRRPVLLLVLLTLLLAAAVLALGPHGPLDGAAFRALRSLVPPYAMIRQPAKIFCVLPSLLAVALGLGLGALVLRRASRRWRVGVLVVAAGVMILDARLQIRAGLCTLPATDAAYAAVAQDAAASHLPARALAVTLWPGDSHYTSLYQHLASRHRVRLVNGYSPVVSVEYLAFIQRFASVNSGWLTSEQADGLLQSGVAYLIVHEDIYPESAGPFPVASVLELLLNHPRLRLLTQSGSIWAFRLLATPEPHAPVSLVGTRFPARRWEAEAVAHTNAVRRVDPDAGGLAVLQLPAPNGTLTARSDGVVPAPGLRYLLRVRGAGALQPSLSIGSAPPIDLAPLAVASEAWIWQELPVPPFTAIADLQLTLLATAGQPDVDGGLLVAGPWDVAPPVGHTVTLPASWFFHAGYLDRERGTVFFGKDSRSGAVWYGPKLPLAAGDYDITFTFTSDAPAGSPLGQFHIQHAEGMDDQVHSVMAGVPVSVRHSRVDNQLLQLVYVFNGAADVTVERATITRLPNQGTAEGGTP
jgi:hypothetical protein